MSTLQHDLHTFMAQVSLEMASEYERIYSKAKQDPGTAGDEGEENWANLLREWLPPAYHVQTKGRLIGHDGAMSPQIDVVVLKPSYPRKLLEKKVWFAGGVAAAFECKTTITSTHIKSSVERCIALKSLYPERLGSPRRELRSPLIYGILAHSHCWKGAASDPLGNVAKAFDESEQLVLHPQFEIDLMCVADLACWSSIYMSSYRSDFKPFERVELERIFGGPVGPATIRTCGAIEGERQSADFRPIGALLGSKPNNLLIF